VGPIPGKLIYFRVQAFCLEQATISQIFQWLNLGYKPTFKPQK